MRRVRWHWFWLWVWTKKLFQISLSFLWMYQNSFFFFRFFTFFLGYFCLFIKITIGIVFFSVNKLWAYGNKLLTYARCTYSIPKRARFLLYTLWAYIAYKTFSNWLAHSYEIYGKQIVSAAAVLAFVYKL